MSTMIFPFIAGVLSWLASGMDDILVLLFMLYEARTKKAPMAIFWGTLLALLFVIILSYTLGYVFTITSPKFLLIPSTALVLYGMSKIYTVLLLKDDESTGIKKNNFFFSAFIMYLMNATDDVSLYFAFFVSNALHGEILFILGILACMILVVFLSNKIINIIHSEKSKHFIQKYPVFSKFFKLVPGSIIIVIGVMLMIKGSF